MVLCKVGFDVKSRFIFFFGPNNSSQIPSEEQLLQLTYVENYDFLVPLPDCQAVSELEIQQWLIPPVSNH